MKKLLGKILEKMLMAAIMMAQSAEGDVKSEKQWQENLVRYDTFQSTHKDRLEAVETLQKIDAKRARKEFLKRWQQRYMDEFQSIMLTMKRLTHEEQEQEALRAVASDDPYKRFLGLWLIQEFQLNGVLKDIAAYRSKKGYEIYKDDFDLIAMTQTEKNKLRFKK